MQIGGQSPTEARDGGYAFARVRSCDAGEHAARLSGWEQTYEQLTPGRFEGRLCEALFGGIQLFRESTNQTVHQLGSGRPGAYMFGVPVSLGDGACFEGRPIGLDSIIVLRDRSALDFRTSAPMELMGLSMPMDALRGYAREIGQSDIDDALRGIAVVQPAPERVRRLRSSLLLVLAAICENPSRLHHPGTRRALELAVYRRLIATFSADGDADLRAPGPARSHALVRRARDYMCEHLYSPLTIEDLCRALGVSRRTLQYGFREVLQLNPVAYLRALRLNGVRRTLRAGGAGTTVQDVAAHWGFWHLSHFAQDYRRMFGELPSETLRAACA